MWDEQKYSEQFVQDVAQSLQISVPHRWQVTQSSSFTVRPQSAQSRPSQSRNFT
jgi:hypothetical protein